MELENQTTRQIKGRKCSFTESVFRYVRLLTVVGGVYPGSNPKTTGKIWRMLTKVCVALLFTVLVTNISFFIASLYYRYLSSKVLTRHSAFASVIVSYVCLSIISSIVVPGALESLEEGISRYEDVYGLTMDTKKWLRRWKATAVTFIMFYVVSPLMTISIFRDHPSIFCDMYPICDIPQSLYMPSLVISGCTSFVGTSLWLGFFINGSFLIFIQLKEFEALNKEFEKLEDLSPGTVDERFVRLVDQHEVLADVVQVTNTYIRGFNFVALFLSIPVNCTMMYSVIISEITFTDIQFLIAGMGIVLFSLGTMMFLQARVASHANAALDHLWTIGRLLVTEKGINNFSLLTCRLSRCPIAYNIYGLISINMSSLLAIFGTLATYIIVVIQFRPTSTDAWCERILRNTTLLDNGTSTLCTV